MPLIPPPSTIASTAALLDAAGYLASRSLTIAVFLALSLRRPLLLEGEVGVGKTALAKAVATALQREYIHLQCYEGLDIASALYEWDYPRQLLALRQAEVLQRANQLTLYDESFLLKRPLLRALQMAGDNPPVLLIDELDRADEPFEAFLLEFLADFSITIPEFKTIRAQSPPIVLITSNRTREINDAVRRRCLYHWVDFPVAEQEIEILRRAQPDMAATLTQQLVNFVQELRRLDLFKIPGIAETLDWARVLHRLQIKTLNDADVGETLGALLKYQDDLTTVREKHLSRLQTQP